ncbi:hypothetical protein [Erythrobacter sp. Alg231-14]|uniref:hypothetical protein n=1 Tax=Erythrobacter sp. Alg231-14 TaxID=1922225 RepID=UPI00307B1352
MRSALFAFLIAWFALPAWTTALADPGTPAERVTRASAIDDGYGAVTISIRSELYLDDPIHVYFLRDGGDVANDTDVVRFNRRQGFFSFGNDTVKYKVQTYQLRAGTYRLVAHGMNCAKVPAINERCLVEEPGIYGSLELSRPSRGYDEDAPSFEVRAGALTNAGDFALTARNTIEWSEIPEVELRRTRSRFGRLPAAPVPVVPEDYRLKYGLNARSYDDDAGRRY